jgi:hypothetical protein
MSTFPVFSDLHLVQNFQVRLSSTSAALGFFGSQYCQAGKSGLFILGDDSELSRFPLYQFFTFSFSLGFLGQSLT